jgi:hypothetical protein
MSADALTTWERAQAVLGLADSEQAKAEFLIDAASMYANRRAGRLLKARAVDMRLDGSAAPVLVLPESPAVVSTLWVDAARVFAEGEELPVSDYHVLGAEGIVRLFYGEFPRGVATVRVVGIFGYDPVPADLEQAVLECVAANLRRLSSPGAIGLKNVSVDGATSSAYEVDWPTTAVMVFDSYRRPRV